MKRVIILLSFSVFFCTENGFSQETVLTVKKNNKQTRRKSSMQPLTEISPGVSCNGISSGSIMQYSELKSGKEVKYGPDEIYNSEDATTGMLESFKNVYWLHGLDGSSDTWKMPALLTEYGDKNIGFPARNAHCIIFTGQGDGNQSYSESIGISFAAMDLSHQARQSNIEHTSKDYVIAHSQGGIVARDWLRKIDNEPQLYPNDIHGLVTFGTPHLGAQILNNCRQDMGNAGAPFLLEACKALSSPKIYELANSSFITRLILSDKDIKKIINSSCSGLSNTIIPIAFQNLTKPTTEDYYVQSPFLTGYTHPLSGRHVEGLSEHPIKVPFVQVYGIEEEPVFWRYLSSMQRLDEDNDAKTTKAFAYDDDNALMEKVAELINTYQTAYDDEFDEVIKATNKWYYVFKYYSPKILNGLSQSDNRYHTLNAYADATQWLMNANEYYKTQIIGSRRITKTNYYCMTENIAYCLCSNNKDYTRHEVTKTATNIPGSCPVTKESWADTYTDKEGFWRCSHIVSRSTFYEDTYTDFDNDGVVTAESAGGTVLYDKNLKDVSYYKLALARTNHSQMLNSKETKKVLINLFDGQYHQVFKIAKL